MCVVVCFYDDNSIFGRVKAYFQFRNNSHKTLTRLIYKVKYYDDFGEVLCETEPLKHPLKVDPGDVTSSDDFCWESYSLSNDFYYILKGAAKAGTIRASVKILKASFVDGSVINFE